MKQSPIEAPGTRPPQRASDMLSPGNTFTIPPPEGESMAIAGRVDRSVKRMIQKIVQSGKTDMETESDFVRSAVVNFIAEHAGELSVFASPEIAQFLKYIQRRKDEARDWDYTKLCNVTQDALVKMHKVSPDRAAVHFLRCIDEVYDIDADIGHEFEKWMRSAPALLDIKNNALKPATQPRISRKPRKGTKGKPARRYEEEE